MKTEWVAFGWPPSSTEGANGTVRMVVRVDDPDAAVRVFKGVEEHLIEHSREAGYVGWVILGGDVGGA